MSTFRILCCLLLLHSFFAAEAKAGGRFIVRVAGGLPLVNAVCSSLDCSVSGSLDGAPGQVFLVVNQAPNSTDATFLSSLTGFFGVMDAEPDLLASTTQASYPVPSALFDRTPVTYFGQTLPNGYVNQPANDIISLKMVQNAFGLTGKGSVIAIIDTGVDLSHQVLSSYLANGYDFTRNTSGGDERSDVTLTSTPYETGQAAWLNGSQASDVDQSTAAVVDGGNGASTSDFGHGTMVAGIVHIVAPQAMLMPLKAFNADGTGYTSDILRAIYWAINHGANILNMSFSLPGYSFEVAIALNAANLRGIISIAAAGNQGQPINSYPAAYNTVIGVGSTNNNDQRSTFSNYGSDVWLAAPGEGIVTTYPFGFFAAGWGTSFSTPYVSGVVALMLQSGGPPLNSILAFENQSSSANSFQHSTATGPGLGFGRLQSYSAVSAWRSAQGILF